MDFNYDFHFYSSTIVLYVLSVLTICNYLYIMFSVINCTKCILIPLLCACVCVCVWLGGLQVHVIRYHDIYWNNIMLSDVILMFSLFISERVNNAVKWLSIHNA